jgi:hypothetical protein
MQLWNIWSDQAQQQQPGCDAQADCRIAKNWIRAPRLRRDIVALLQCATNDCDGISGVHPLAPITAASMSSGSMVISW